MWKVNTLFVTDPDACHTDCLSLHTTFKKFEFLNNRKFLKKIILLKQIKLEFALYLILCNYTQIPRLHIITGADINP